jgi:hypothetical protein
MPTDKKTPAFIKGKEIAEELATALNSMGRENEVAEGFKEGLFSTHPTLQQNIGKLILDVLIATGKRQIEDRGCDMRNEDFYKFARKIHDMNEENPIYMRFI